YDAGGWRVEKHPRTVADVNGDGRADIVGFANDGVYVALSTGTGFTAGQFWLGEFGYDAGGWRVEKHPRTAADVNRDGRADIVGFANDGVYVALSTGTGFTAGQF
ncbi:VCBS repeat-containing protein, partial [Pyxidicoccus fallax]